MFQINCALPEVAAARVTRLKEFARRWSIGERRLKGATWKAIIHLATRIERAPLYLYLRLFSSSARNLQINGWSDTVICFNGYNYSISISHNLILKFNSNPHYNWNNKYDILNTFRVSIVHGSNIKRFFINNIFINNCKY